MLTITVEKVHSKEIMYNDKKTGEPKSFMKYAALCKDVWYEIRGRGKENIKEGDALTGDYSTQDWESGGKTGTNHILQLLDQFQAEMLRRIERLEMAIETGTTNPEIESDNNDDLPF